MVVLDCQPLPLIFFRSIAFFSSARVRSLSYSMKGGGVTARVTTSTRSRVSLEELVPPLQSGSQMSHISPRYSQPHRTSHPLQPPPPPPAADSTLLRSSFFVTKTQSIEPEKKVSFLSRFAAISRRKAALHLLSKPIDSALLVELDSFRIPHVYLSDTLASRRREVMIDNDNFSILNRDTAAATTTTANSPDRMKLAMRELSPQARRLASMSVGVFYPRLHEITSPSSTMTKSSTLRSPSTSIHSISMKNKSSCSGSFFSVQQ